MRSYLRNLIAAGIALATFEALAGSQAYGWGPATHVQLAHDVLAHLALLPATVAGVLSRFAVDYIFGNLAADVVFAKKKTRIRQICHQWTTGFWLLDHAPTDSGRAFAYGYLSHLAADTVAHNKFIPRQVVLNRTSRNFGHLYWELRADLTVHPRYWDELRWFVGRRFDEHEAHMATRLTGTLLSFETNLHVFHRINRVVTRKSFRRGITAWDRLSRHDLCAQMVTDYRLESLDRIHCVLNYGPDTVVTREDPNGNQALRMTGIHRRQSRRLARMGLGMCGRLAELMEQRAPNPKPRPLLPPPAELETVQRSQD